ncbi:hypothetical protein [Microbacterium sp. NPDC089184]|uniref:hypothetical protein n=1 Tax=Microbacterium sp. NPDC089184 TaxID=3154967 RepID=UPI003440F397
MTVVFLPATITGASVSNHLRDYLFTNPLTAELWLVAPSFAEAGLRATQDAAFKDRIDQSAALDAVRLMIVNRDGSWSELRTSPSPSIVVDKTTRDEVLATGLRVMFREGHGLAQAPAGLHYSKPGGKHSEFFLRTGAVVARSALAYFAAVALLPTTSLRTYGRIWVDTNAIASVAHALTTLLAMFDGKPRLIPVDSFGGHERLHEHALVPSEEPLVLISASTSGSLARKLEQELGIEGSDIVTLFSVGPTPPTPVLCDLTSVAPGDTDEHRFEAFDSWESGGCPLCKQGRSLISLQGEEFVPDTARATERTLKAVHSNKALRDFIRVFIGKDVIRAGRKMPTLQGTARTVSFELAAQLKDPASPVRARVVEELRRRIPARIRYIVSLGDTDSEVVAQLTKEVCDEAGLVDVTVLPKSELGHSSLQDGHVFVVAGTVGTGRQLLNVSRLLRPLKAEMLHYFVVCGRPRSNAAWSSLQSDLRFAGSANFYPMHTIWLVDSEPDRHSRDPWTLELQTLRYVSNHLPQNVADEGVSALTSRINELIEEAPSDDMALFAASDYGAAGSALQLNPNFAFWDSGTMADAGGATDDEIYFTMATVMHHFRYAAEGQYALFGLPGHSYVLSPLTFGRFNDPIIQACILRTTQGGELDYRSHSETSRHMADEILHLLSGHDDAAFGGAATEFVLSLARGIVNPDPTGALRLQADDLARVGEFAESVSAAQYPLLSALLRFIAAAPEPV